MSKGKKRGPRERTPRVYNDQRGERYRRLTKKQRDRERLSVRDQSAFLATFSWFKQVRSTSESSDA